MSRAVAPLSPFSGTQLPGTPLSGAPSPGEAGGYPAEQIVLTVPLIDDAGLVLAAVPASNPLSLAKARRALSSPLLRRATLDETQTALPGISPVAIPPFGMPLGLRALADDRLLTYNRVVCASGRPDGALLIDAGDLISTGRAQVADICEGRADEEDAT